MKNIVILLLLWRIGDAAPALQPVVEAEESVYTYQSANNGAGPLWCSGSTCLARIGDEIFASGLETLPDEKPLNNCRWTLFRRHNGSWQLEQADAVGRTREPCPLAGFPDGHLLLSVNPTLTASGSYSGPARPEILRFGVHGTKAKGQSLLPIWEGTPRFAEHSYRSFAADGPGAELILFQNVDYTHAEWTFRDRDGKWAAQGKLTWPQRFQVTADNRLIVIFYVGGTASSGKAVSENRVQEILPNGEMGPAARIPFKQPFISYFTATVRGGSPPSTILEVLGQRAGEPLKMCYARVRLW